MIRIPEQVIKDITEYPNRVQEYLDGKIEPERFKPYRVSMGIYEQRDNNTFMVRSRIPSGCITIEQLQKISELAEQYSHGFIHFTSRQDIQFHKVSIKDTTKILEELLKVGVITRGTGGNTLRNVGCSPLSGAEEEVFDVTPYALATTELVLKDFSALQLPRKYKIAFSNSDKDTGYATIADLGFIAKEKDGKLGFQVYGSGGLGGKPTVGIVLEDFIPAHEFLYHIIGMKNLFEKEGDRTNKHKARIRFIRYRLGDAGFITRYGEEVKLAKESQDLDLYIDIPPTRSDQFSVYVHPTNGNLKVTQLQKILKVIEKLPYEPSLRLSNTQGFYVRKLTDNDAKKLQDIIQEFTSIIPVDHSVACAGAATCKLGLCLSQNLLKAIAEEFKEQSQEIRGQIPRIFISGCPNSCGQHQRGEIGFAGKAIRKGKGLIPQYTVFFNGRVGGDSPALGIEHGDLPAKKIPEFLVELAKLKNKSGIEDFREFYNTEQDEIYQLIQTYQIIDEEDESLYFDFGSDEPFSLKGRGPGECSAGVLDVIRLDLSNAKNALDEYEKTKESKTLYQAGISAARALLILRGVDSSKERVILQEFLKHFIDTGYVKHEVKELMDTLIDFKLGDIKDLKDKEETVEYLVERVGAMFDSLSPQLEITLEKEEEKESSVDQLKVDRVNEQASYKIVDFKGVKCPINFVKVKIELSKIPSGEAIGFYLDDGEPITNVPKSVEREGHQVLSIDTKYDGYNLLVVKKK